jgi:two-component system NtrC family sensor kinase
VDAVTLLITEDDAELCRMLAQHARLRGFEPFVAQTFDQAVGLIAAQPFHAALVDLTLGARSGLDAIRAIKEKSADTEIVVMSGTTSVASAIASYESKAFAFVPKPFDVDQLFSTLERALEHRRVRLANRRLLWEQQLVNEIGDELRHLLAPEALVEGVLRRLVRTMSVDVAGARMLNPDTREYDIRMVTAPDSIREMWVGPNHVIPRPSDRVLESKAPVITSDLHAGLTPEAAASVPLRSTISVPMFAAEQLIGVLNLGSCEPNRFGPDDERLFGVIANHVAVAFLNARLHAFVRTGKHEWEATFDAIGDPIAVFDRKGVLLRGNAALASCIGRPLTELRGLTCDEIGLCGGQFPECAVGRARNAACVHDEVTVPEEQIFSVTTCPVLDVTDGAAIVQIAKNVTHERQNARRVRQMSEEIAGTNARLVATVDRLKATQAQLLQAEKLSAIGQLVAGVAHELNNPLTSVIGYAQLLQEEFKDGGEPEPVPASPPASPKMTQLMHDLRRIAEESERAAKIVRNLLAFARRQSAARAPQDVGDVMNRVLALRAYEFRLNAIELETAFDEGLPPVLGDGGQLQQALLNLLLNAEQAMRSRPVRRIRVGARYVAEAEAVELFISDSGQGIPDENLRRIFDPFFTTREVGEGTGLGLSICYGIIRDHGGQIGVESRVGQGTTFTVLLPARSSSSSETLQILVAHRDTTERDYVAAALAGWGHDVVAAENVDDALARLANARIDLALIDHALMTPDDTAWTAALARRAQAPAVILMTEAAEDKKGVAAPFELSALRLAVRSVTARNGAAGEAAAQWSEPKRGAGGHRRAAAAPSAEKECV